MAEKEGTNSKSAAELRLEQLQKWREARGRQHRPGREPLTPGIIQHSTKANLPPSRTTSTKKSSAVKRKQKENAAQEDSYLERFEQWRSEKKKKQERESASKRPPWRPCSASKTNLLSQPLTRCCNHHHGAATRSRKRLAMDAGPAAGPGAQDNAKDQDNQELHIENNQDDIEDLIEDNQEVMPLAHNHVDNTAELQPSENVDIEFNQDNLAKLGNDGDNHEDSENMKELQPPVNNMENSQDNFKEFDPEVIPELGNLENNQEDIPVEEEEEEDGAQPNHMATEHDLSQDMKQVTFEEQFTELSSPGAEDLTDDTTALPPHPDALNVPETETAANTAVTPLIHVSDGEAGLNMENGTDSQEDDDDLDIIAAATVPKKMSMRQKLEQWLKEKGKTPSRFNSILTFRTPAPGSARRKLRKRRSAAPFWPGLEHAGKEEEHAGKDIVTLELEAIFRECMSAIDEGYPSDNISGILDTVFSSIPQCVQHSQYWLCRAGLAEAQGDDHRVVSMFEMAVTAHAEPYEDIKDALTAFVLRKEAELSQSLQTSEDTDGIDHVQPTVLFKTPRRRSAFPRLDQGAAFDSSMKMYSVTPLFRRAHGVLRKAAAVPVAKVAPIVVTPVRRSARIHRASALHPPALREHDPCVSSLADVAEDEFVLRANKALVRESSVVNSDDSVLRCP